ncbi:MAG: rhomboid family intramembrane serine protease [Sphingomonas sp.]
MNGIDLPRGRCTDGLIAFLLFATILQLVPAIAALAAPFAFVPALVWAGAWASDPIQVIVSPLASQFLLSSLFNAVFNGVFLLIAGRFVERSVGPVGLALTFVAGAYAGALARLLLSWGSPLPTMGANAGLFAIVGAYFMLYGVPRALPVPRHYGRVGQIAALALIWILIDAAFMMMDGFEFSVTFFDPLGGLAAGMALARPLLAWRYRKA